MDEVTLSRDVVHRLHERLDSQDILLKDIKVALIGDLAMGHRGAIARIADAEAEVQKRAYKSEVKTIHEKVEKHDRKLWLAGIIVTVLAWALPMFFSKK